MSHINSEERRKAERYKVVFLYLLKQKIMRKFMNAP